MIQRDYIMRLIEQILAFIAKALGLAREGRHEEARREIELGYDALGIPRHLIDRLDANSIRVMAGEKLSALLRLVRADAEVSRQRGDTVAAERRERLAAELSVAGAEGGAGP